MSDLIQYTCKDCKRTFFLIEDEVTYSEQESRYITCPYDGRHKSITVSDRYGSLKELKECMEDGQVFKRIRGRMVRVRK